MTVGEVKSALEKVPDCIEVRIVGVRSGLWRSQETAYVVYRLDLRKDEGVVLIQFDE